MKKQTTSSTAAGSKSGEQLASTGQQAQRGGQKSKTSSIAAVATVAQQSHQQQQQAAATEIISTMVPTANQQQLSDQDAMSDDEDSAVLLRMESEVSLPRAPVKQLIMEKLPETARIHQQSKELISNLCMHFLSHLAEQSNEFCSAQNKKTVCPDHVLDALTKMNLTRYFPKLAALDEEELQKQSAAAQGKKNKQGAKKLRGNKQAQNQQNQAVKSLLDDPQRLRQAILVRLSQSMEGCSKMRAGGKKRPEDMVDDHLTAEERNLEQEKLLAEARDQYEKQQLAAQQAALAEVSTSQQQQMSAGAGFNEYGDANGIMQGLHPDGDQHDMIDMPPFIPTDYFREMIFMTDFMNEQDLNYHDYGGGPLPNGGEYVDGVGDPQPDGPDQCMAADGQQALLNHPIDQIVNEDAEMAEEEGEEVNDQDQKQDGDGEGRQGGEQQLDQADGDDGHQNLPTTQQPGPAAAVAVKDAPALVVQDVELQQQEQEEEIEQQQQQEEQVAQVDDNMLMLGPGPDAGAGAFSMMFEESFVFEDEELEALKAFESMQLKQRSTTADVNAAKGGEAGGASESTNKAGGTARNQDNNTKPKEQNDQEMMVAEESKQPARKDDQ